MPKATLPTTAHGWLVALAASLVGLVSSFAFLAAIEKVIR